MATATNCPPINPEDTYYHAWKVADGGNGMFRVRKNFRTRQAAQGWLDRNGFSKMQMGGQKMKVGVILACKLEERSYCGCTAPQSQRNRVRRKVQ